MDNFGREPQLDAGEQKPDTRSTDYPVLAFYRRRSFQVTLLAVILVVLAVVVAIFAASSSENQVKYVQGDLDKISVRGRAGATPVVKILGKIPSDLNQVSELTAGTGREIYENSPVLLALYPFSAKDGTSLTETGKPSFRVGLATSEELGTTLFDAVKNRKEGSRLLLVRSKPNSDSELIVVDILPTQADGKEAPPEESEGILKVQMTDYGPVIDHGTVPPSVLSIQILRKGNGAQIHDGDSIIAQYTALKWTNKEIIDSSWRDGIPVKVELEGVMSGLKDALIDQRVGTRLAVTIPPDAATGDDTVVVLVDILALAS